MILTWTHAAIALGLLLFGIAYNAIVNCMEKHGHDRGYTALLVVGGNLITVAAAAILIGVETAQTVIFCFAASGLPMIIGSARRYMLERKQEEEIARQVAIALNSGGRDADA